jgi:hypothetical protein
LEAAGAEIRGSVETVWKIQQALEAAGIEFISAEGGKGPGVRLKAPARPAQKSGRKGAKENHTAVPNGECVGEAFLVDLLAKKVQGAPLIID